MPRSEAERAAQARYDARWRARNLETARAQGRERMRRYAAEDPERAREKTRRWRAANPDKAREQVRRDSERNREAGNARAKAIRAANPERMHAKFLRLKHGMRPEDWSALWESQGGKCYLCGNTLAEGGAGKIAIDHDHSCCPPGRSCNYCRRGIACGNCNPLIGFAGDDPDRLRRIADNLERVLRITRERMASKPEQLTLMEMEGDGDVA